MAGGPNLKTYLSGSQWITKYWDTTEKTVKQYVLTSGSAYSRNTTYVIDVYQTGNTVRRVHHDGNGGVTFDDLPNSVLLKTIVNLSLVQITVYWYSLIGRNANSAIYATDTGNNFSLSTTNVIDSYCQSGGVLREVHHDGYGSLSNVDIAGSPLCGSTDPYFEISLMNAIRFVVDGTIDSCSNPETQDNVLFHNQLLNNITVPGYYIKVQQCDIIKNQFRSNFDSNVVTIKNAQTGTTIQTINPSMVVQNTRIIENDFGFIVDNGAGTCRVYFNGDMPIYIEEGNYFQLNNSSVSGYDGGYVVVSIKYDASLQKNYLVITHTYTGTQTRVNTTIKSYYQTADYNVYEFDVNFGTYPEGFYQIEIDATDTTLGTASAKSELLYVKQKHDNTVLLKYKNFDNAFDMDYVTGYEGIMRIEAFFWKRKPLVDRKILRDCGSIKKVSSYVYRKILLETIQLPAYLHEKLTVLFEHDYYEVNGVQFNTDESYDVNYTQRWALANGSIYLEQVGLFDKNNSDDLGSVDDKNGFIKANNGYLKR